MNNIIKSILNTSASIFIASSIAMISLPANASNNAGNTQNNFLASKSSVEKLIEASKAQESYKELVSEVDKSIASIEQMANNTKYSSEQEEINYKKAVSKIISSIKQETSWAKLQNTIIDAYATTYNQEEVNGLIAFYKTNIGKALIAKNPAISKKILAATQESMNIILTQFKSDLISNIESIGVNNVK
jgi:uncharacterized protein